jgi:hypothetical protein
VEYYSATKKNEILSSATHGRYFNHYVKWTKPGAERQTLHDLTNVKSKNVDLIEIEYTMVVAKAGESGRVGGMGTD